MTSGNDIMPYEGGQLDGYRPQIMTPEAARALDEQVRQCTRAVLREGTDFGVIPGTGDDRKVLLKPGAEKLLQWFGFGFRCDRLEVDLDDEGRKQGVTYRCVITRRAGGSGVTAEVTTCEGYAGYDEPKFYKSAEQARRDAEAKERHWAKVDKRVANPTKWKDLGEYRAPWNTVIKMAQKRAIVGATITATAAAGLFTADDDSDGAPADGGPSWYQRALGEASAVATREDANRLWAEAVQAKLSGLATADQETHVHNRLRQRMARLAPVQVTAEDLADAAAAAAEDVPPAETPAAADAAAGPAGGTRPPARIASGQKEQLEAQRRRLGYGDSEEDWGDWLADLAKLAGLEALASPAELTQAEAKGLIGRLKTVNDAAGLHRLLEDGEVPDGR